MQLHYGRSSRHTAFHGGQSIRLESNCLQQLRRGQIVRSIPLHEVVRVNLAFLGSNYAGNHQMAGYRCRVTDQNGTSIEFRNLFYASFYRVSRQDTDYLNLVFELHDRLVKQGRSDTVFTQGSSAFYWLGWFGVIASILLTVMIPMMLMIEGGATMLLRKAWTFALVPVLLGGTFVPLICRGRNRPYSPDVLPVEHLPIEGLLRDLEAARSNDSP